MLGIQTAREKQAAQRKIDQFNQEQERLAQLETARMQLYAASPKNRALRLEMRVLNGQ